MDLYTELRSLLVTVVHILSEPLIAAGVLAGAVSLAVAGLLAAHRWNWRPVPAVLAGLGLGLVLGVTLSRVRSTPAWTPGGSVVDTPFCQLNNFSVAGGSELLNVLLFVPPVFFAVLATRRPVPVLGAAVGLSALIELVQTLSGRGVCETQDLLNNSVGALVAAVAGAGVLALEGLGSSAVVSPPRSPRP